ncbi:MAG: PQQ-binding-like beta-propeller repeat protein [Planctomycetales bacterium]
MSSLSLRRFSVVGRLRDRTLAPLVVLAAALVAAPPARLAANDARNPRATADQWPQFKGDSARTGDNPHAELNFPLARTTAVRLPAPIYASPAVVGDRVYVQDARGHLVCVDSRSNTFVWLAENGGTNNTSSPAVYDGKLYVGSTAGHLAIHDAETGRLVAKVPAPGPVLASPAVANGAVYFSTFDGQLVKIDPAGNVVWTFSGGDTSITEFAVKGERIIFFAGTTRANAYRLQDHGDKVEMLERGRSTGGYFAPTGGPVFLTDEDYASQSYDSESGWFHGFGKAIEGGSNDSRITASVRDNRVYRGNKCWEFDPETKQVREVWRADPDALYDGGFHSSPALAKNVMAIGSELGIVHFLPLDGELAAKPLTRKAVWQFRAEGAGRPNGAVSSSPAVVNGRVFFGGEDGILYGLGQGDDVAIVDAPFSKESWQRTRDEPLAGAEWVTTGGDMGFSCVAGPSKVRPPFRVAWRTRVWSTFKGNMVVGGGKVFGAGRMGPLVALDARTGEILWKTHHQGVESRVSPTYADGRLYVLRVQGGLKTSPYFRGWYGGPNGEGLWCHDAETGEVLWHHPIDTAYQFNSDGLPVHSGRVFVCEPGDDGQLQAAAYDAQTGKLAWRKPIEGIDALHKVSALMQPPRYSGVIADGLWCVSVRGWGDKTGVTLAFEPETGKVVWRNDEVAIENRTRVAARKGTLVVFNLSGSHGFEAQTGKPLWSEDVLPADTTEAKRKSAGALYMQALTDGFLESGGKEDVFHISGCILPVHVNGLWYSHTINSTHVMHAWDADKKTVWKRTFLSHACPSPVPAYDRLYYAPNSEGVIYCFENEPGNVAE